MTAAGTAALSTTRAQPRIQTQAQTQTQAWPWPQLQTQLQAHSLQTRSTAPRLTCQPRLAMALRTVTRVWPVRAQVYLQSMAVLSTVQPVSALRLVLTAGLTAVLPWHKVMVLSLIHI